MYYIYIYIGLVKQAARMALLTCLGGFASPLIPSSPKLVYRSQRLQTLAYTLRGVKPTRNDNETFMLPNLHSGNPACHSNNLGFHVESSKTCLYHYGSSGHHRPQEQRSTSDMTMKLGALASQHAQTVFCSRKNVPTVVELPNRLRDHTMPYIFVGAVQAPLVAACGKHNRLLTTAATLGRKHQVRKWVWPRLT